MTEFRKRLDYLLKDFKKAYISRNNLNYMLLPVNKFELTQENIDKVNEITTLLHENNFSKIRRTKSGGISINRSDWDPNCFDIKGYGAGIEITICAGYSLRIQLGHVEIDESGKNISISGKQAFNRFIKELKKDNIDINKYQVKNGEIINEEIVKPRIKSYVANEDIEKAQIFKNAHHLDFHKAYMSGLYKSHKEFRTTISRLYDLRKEDPKIKAVFTNTIGFMHSSKIGWKYAGLAKDAINTFNELLDEVAYNLAKSGRRILAYNTDGIWYTGEIYHGEHEGANLTEWENDYVNCTIRFKSDGAYEFLDENGKYYAKIRGKTKLDRIEPNRENWKWGDIFKLDATVLQYVVKNGYLIEQGE